PRLTRFPYTDALPICEREVCRGNGHAVVPDDVWSQLPGQLHAAVRQQLPSAVFDRGHLLRESSFEAAGDRWHRQTYVHHVLQLLDRKSTRLNSSHVTI